MALCNQIKTQCGLLIRVRGLVQGVGFRPTVARIAKDCSLVGEVMNDGSGVLIRVWGDPPIIKTFLHRIESEAPPLARIEDVETCETDADTCPPTVFSIVGSKVSRVLTGIIPDAATCPECLADIFDPTNRRYRYAFTNCTHCGPRLSIVRAIPYDRANTSMASFDMCKACQKEYDDPTDRRYHAQPNACVKCGPRLWLEDRDGNRCDISVGHDSIGVTAELISSGHIVAIKGIGGFHLACDARNTHTVTELRHRKKRYDKPFALMARDIPTIERFVNVSSSDRKALQSAEAPIVIMDQRRGGESLAYDVAPNQDSLGFMLPYTPLHHVLLNDLNIPIVLTSGNRSDEPQVIACSDARERLNDIADYWLMHDRKIINRLDDSVVRTSGDKAQILRRARGFAPAPIALPPGFEKAGDILAMGGELKNTFCIVRSGQAILSQHIGDLENTETHKGFRANLALYRKLYDFCPTTIAVDKHADYLSTQWGAALAQNETVHIELIQHHHAHIAACMAENGLPIDTNKVLGIALDGSGLGEDGKIWGGEFFAADYKIFNRLAHFSEIPLLGGSKAIREPWRAAFAHLDVALGWGDVAREFADLDIIRYLQEKPLAQMRMMTERKVNAPFAVSVGRLFDAVAAVLGLCRDEISYEGQAAIELEALASQSPDENEHYPFDCEDGHPKKLVWRNLWLSIFQDLAKKTPPSIIAARFHNTLIEAVSDVAGNLVKEQDFPAIVLTGGAFQNRLLLSGVHATLKKRTNKPVLIHKQVPANDGGLSFGQAVIAWARKAKWNQ